MDATAAPRIPMRPLSVLFVLLFSLLLTGCLSADGDDGADSDSTDTEVEGEDDSVTEATLREIIPAGASGPSVISGVFQLSDTATDEPLTGLTPDDFHVLENENPLLDTHFLTIAPMAEMPDLAFTQTVSVVFQANEALNGSDTENIRDTLRQLIDTMPAHREMALYSFGEEVTQHSSPTSDTEALHEAVDGIGHNEGGGYSAALHDALIEATQPLENSLDLDEGITQGSLLLITRANDMAGNESREDVLEALADFPAAILSIDSDVQADLRELTTEPLFHPVADFDSLTGTLEQARESLSQATAATYAFYYASARRSGDNSMRLSLAPSKNRALDEDLTMDFNADEFSSVAPEIIVFPPDELLQGEVTEFELFTRWSNHAPDYVVESESDGIDVELIKSLDRLRITAGEEASGEQNVDLANDAHAGTQTTITLEVIDPDNGDDPESGDDENGGDEEE